MTEQRVYEVLADSFTSEDVDTCFALLGDANMNWACALAGNGCRFVYVRHEHCAVAAAMAYARSTGKIGVATVTCGPGLTQVMTALPAAVRARIPLLIFAGEAPLKSTWYNQGIDQKPFVDACGAQYVSLHHQQTMRAQLRDAFLQAHTTSQPVVVGVPLDMQNETWTGSLAPIESSFELLPAREPRMPAEHSFRTAVERINCAKKIVVMAGLGAVNAKAGPACRLLAAKTGGLLATTLPAKGLFYDDPFSLGVAGGFSSETARKYLSQADLIIAVGASLASHNSDGGKLFSAERVLQIDVNPNAVSQGRPAAKYHLACDARAGVEALVKAIDDQTRAEHSDAAGSEPGDSSIAKVGEQASIWRSDSIAIDIRDAPADRIAIDAAAAATMEPGLLDPRAVVKTLDDLIPVDWFTVNSSGHCSCFFAQMKNRPAERFLTIREFGAIGNGLSFAMGVASAHPDEAVVLFDGDGSFLMHIQELETIRRHNLNILVVIMNDGAYGSEVHKLRAEGLSEQGAVFGRPDFAAIAISFGLQGATVSNVDQLAGLIDEFAMRTGSPGNDATGCNATILDVQISDKVVSSVIQRSHPH